MFMSSCTFFVFLSLIEYAFVNVMMGDIREGQCERFYFTPLNRFYVKMPSKVPIQGNSYLILIPCNYYVKKSASGFFAQRPVPIINKEELNKHVG
jgi:hypothetical protein